jgi:hypothetical protein
VDIDASQQRFADFPALKKVVGEMAFAIRHGKLEVGRPNYALPLLMGAMEAVCCGHSRLTAVEMGVAKGRGLLDLCAAAAHLRAALGVDIRVVGFDNATGLPPPHDFRDHPELWDRGEFLMQDADELRAQLPDFARLIIGDIADTVATVRDSLLTHPLGFMSVDVDYYSSTVSCLKLLDFAPECYLPAIPSYFDDLEIYITNSKWSGEPLAIAEFNEAHTSRKLQRNRESRIIRFYTVHVLDHPLRTGKEKPRFPLRVPIY